MKRHFIAAKVVLCLLLAIPAFSQTNASLSGTVSDTSGGIIPGVSVKATNNATGVVSNTLTNDSGVYNFASLPTGTYTVMVNQPGFQPKTFTDVRLATATRASLNFELDVEGVATQVQVTSSAKDLLLETSSSSGDVLSLETVQELPLINRDALELVDVMSGVVKTDNTIFNANESSFAGVGANGVNIQRDGVIVNDVRWPTGINAATRVNPDLVGEFKMVLAPVDAEMGRGNAQLQITTRQGANDFHGNAVWTAQNTALDPNTWENNRNGVEPPWRNLHIFSGSVSGPIIKNKTFFFVLFDGQLNKIRTPYNVLTLTPCARQGIFRYFDNWNNGNPISNPEPTFGFTPTIAVVDRAGNPVAPTVNPDESPHNGILRYASVFGEIMNPGELSADCSNAIIGDTPWDPNRPVQDPTGFVSTFLDLMPVANNYDIGDGLNTAGHRWSRTLKGADNLFGIGEDTYRRQINLRIDHNFSDKHRINGSWSWEYSYADDNFKNWPNGYGGKSERRPQVLTINLISSVKPTLLNEFRFGMSRTGSNIFSPYTNPDTGEEVQALLPKTNTGVPVVVGLGAGDIGFQVNSANGFSNFYGGRGILSYSGKDTSPRWSLGDTISWTRGTHSFRFGGDFRRASSLAENAWTGPFSAGLNPYPYAQGGESVAVQGITAEDLPGSIAGTTSSGNLNNMEDLLVFHAGSLGEIRQWRYINSVDATGWNDPVLEPTIVRDVIQKEFSLFFKDDWKVTSDFTLNLGLRYDYYGIPYLKNGLTTGLLGGGSSLFGLTGSYANWFAPIGQGDVPTGSLTELEFIGPNSPNPDKALFSADVNNFGPAVGFSWQLPFFGKGKTTIRGGYQMNYIGSVGNFSGIQTNAGQAPGTTYSNIYRGSEGEYLDLTSVAALGNEIPVPSEIVPGLAAFPLYENTQNITVYSPDYVTPYIQNITFGITRNVTNTLTVDARYIGTLTRKNYSSLDLNLPNFLTNGLLEAFESARYGGNPALLDELLMGQFGVDGVTVHGGQALRDNGGFIFGIPLFRPGWLQPVNRMLANGNYSALANMLTYIGGNGQYMEDNGFPANFIKANPQFDQATFSNNNGHANYHSMQLQVTLRPTVGVNFTSTYTWSKNLGRSGVTDPRNLNMDYTLLPSHRTHNWVTYGGWELPFGHGRLIGDEMHEVLDRIVGGWNLSWIGTVQSGSPLNITAQSMLYGNGVPDLVGDFDFDSVGTYWPDGASRGDYFGNKYEVVTDPQCLAIDPSIQSTCTLTAVADKATGEIVLQNPVPGDTGSIGRGRLRNLTRWNVDMAISKMFRIDESRSFRLRLDASNVFNKVFASGGLGGTGTRIVFPTSPNTDINSSSFGWMPYKVGGRTFQMMLRFDF
ncbi:MAG: TonB-dependent receptor [Acidobacteriota bacterium]